MSRRDRRRPETPEEIEAENVDFWTRTARRHRAFIPSSPEQNLQIALPLRSSFDR